MASVISSIRRHLPEVQRLVDSVQRAASQMEQNTKKRSCHWTLSGPGYQRWLAATQELVRVTAQEVTKAVGPSFAQPAADFVYQAAYYVFMAVIAGSIDPTKGLTGNLSAAKGLTLTGYGLPTFNAEVTALRNQVADLVGSYKRSASGNWSSAPIRATSGPILTAWDAMVASLTRA